jgi:uncharacterized membrane protein
VAAVVVVLGYFLLRNKILTDVVETDQYTSFTVEAQQVENTKCDVNITEQTEQVDCLVVNLTDPTNGEEVFTQIVEQTYQLRSSLTVSQGDLIRINKITNLDDTQYVFTGFDRSLAYFWMLVIFIGTVVIVGGMRGFRSVFSLLVSILLIAKVIIPLIIAGYDPLYVILGVGFLMFAAQIYLTNGFNKQSHASLLGAVVGIGTSALLAHLFSNMAQITGFGDENSGFLALNAPNSISIREIVIASFILGVLGVVDDATVSQVSVVSELLVSNPKMDKLELFKSAMRVGASHIGSLMNTLFIAYVASALPLMTLLFIYNPHVVEIINIDLFAEEIVRTLVGSMGLVLSIPAATYFATTILRPKDVKEHVHKH